MAKVWVLQHHPAENLGAIADALESAALASGNTCASSTAIPCPPT